MKLFTLHKLLGVGLIAAAPLLHATPSAKPTAGEKITGVVLQVRDVAPYTYLRIKTGKGEQWAVVDKAAVAKGSTVSVEAQMVMDNFESKSLGKTFTSIVFGSLVGAPAGAGNPHEGVAQVAPVAVAKLAKASGNNAYTVADLYAKAGQLNNKPVRLSATVVKFSADIMGKNWLHLQDGSGSAVTQNHDILATSSASAQIGDVLTVSGTLRSNVDLGMGYTYKVLIESATLSKP
ncbi:hypothetical protein [Rhodoferax antarcticus]|uniref:Nucleic acid binding, OB-fold, tRNA/helicase-type n=1 Tax=Rhodoferax antarcticus ANT.BR TaxID=1111071 RepID=A0A1Q8YGJ3_9BURK|nr:hypothetical protein [Rhodoferax antarcticus]APW45549.1 hypothetical protein RA876_03245 [Rhodoferax antarcticus]MCW2312880.1 hypothetical protein [Rhodoferax antarcticus]OLP07020.1 nucleic acid binding, OB-fold, tRNA/helicase-type [Rhodoferax antarcticus ANT.BR]